METSPALSRLLIESHLLSPNDTHCQLYAAGVQSNANCLYNGRNTCSAVYFGQSKQSSSISPCILIIPGYQNLTEDQTGLDISEQSPHSASFEGEEPTKYQLWPHPPSRAACSLGLSAYFDHKSMALAVGRSPTSLSDTVITQDNSLSWRLGGSLARRRNISVPELNNKIDQSTRSTYQESFADSRMLQPLAFIHRNTTDSQQQLRFLVDQHFVKLLPK